MKSFLIIIILFSIQLFAQDTSIVVSDNYQRDTLTTARDTIDIYFSDDEDISYVSISTYIISSGADSLKIYTKSLDNVTWCQQSMTDNLADTTGEIIIVSTTPKEWTITNDSQPWAIRIISLSNDGSSTVITVNGKKEGL